MGCAGVPAMTSAIDRAAIATAVATAALTAIVVGAINVGIDEVKHMLAERRERRKADRS